MDSEPLIFSSAVGFDRAPGWSALAREHLKREPFCRACGGRESLEVHHIIPVSFDSSRELDSKNLLTLCSARCHLLVGHCGNWSWRNPHSVRDAAIVLCMVHSKQTAWEYKAAYGY